jgi:hypothetical protein
MLRERPLARLRAAPIARAPSGRRHFATLAQSIRINLDAKMAGYHRRKGGAQTSSHD